MGGGLWGNLITPSCPLIHRILEFLQAQFGKRSHAFSAPIVAKCAFYLDNSSISMLAVRSALSARAPVRMGVLRRRLSGLISPTAGLSEDEAAYASAASAFAAAEFEPHAAGWHQRCEFPVAALRSAAAAGLAGLNVRAESGGMGLSRLETVPVIEALAAADTSTTAYLTIHNMVAAMIDRHASPKLRAMVLPRLLTMEHMASYCLTEPGAGSDAAALATRAVREGDEYILHGTKSFISGGGRSDLYAVMARTGGPGPGGISCLLVPAAGATGLSFGAQERKLGWRTQPTCQVFFDGVRVPAVNLLGVEGAGFKMALQALNGGRLSIAACSLGAANACLASAISYVKERRQFGAPLAALQATQFKIARMATRLATARAMLHAAARALDAGAAHAPAACAAAKQVATDYAFDIVNDALQLHGGYGYLVDYKIERYLRDVRVHQILEGTNESMSVIVAREILAD